MNQPEAHWILQALRCIVDIFTPGVLLKAEAIVPTRELPAYFGESADAGKECHLAYHSSLMAAGWVALAEEDTSVLRRVIEATPELPQPASWLTYVRCHDDIGWKVLRPEVSQLGFDDTLLARVSRFLEGESGYANGVAFQTSGEAAVHGTNGMAASLVGFDRAATAEDAELAQRRLVLMYSLALCFGGLPMIYMGDELAMTNDVSEACLAAARIDSRWVQRPVMDAAQFAARHDANTRTGKVFSALRRMVRVRGLQDAFAADAARELVMMRDAALLVLKRGDGFVLAANFSGSGKTIDLAKDCGMRAGPWLECLTEERIDGKLHLGPWQVAWLK
jgi:amylosucrase